MLKIPQSFLEYWGFSNVPRALNLGAPSVALSAVTFWVAQLSGRLPDGFTRDFSDFTGSAFSLSAGVVLLWVKIFSTKADAPAVRLWCVGSIVISVICHLLGEPLQVLVALVVGALTLAMTRSMLEQPLEN